MSDLIVPNNNDIMLGRGGNNNKHTGNEQLRSLAREICEKYMKASKKEKSAISKKLVDDVHGMSPAGRFITYDRKSKQWKEVKESVAREKTGQVLRDAMRARGLSTMAATEVEATTQNSAHPEPKETPMTAQKGMVEASPWTPPRLPTFPVSFEVSSPSRAPWLVSGNDASASCHASLGRTELRTSTVIDRRARRTADTPFPPLPVVPSTPPRMSERKRPRHDFSPKPTWASMWRHSPQMPAPKRRMASNVALPTPPPVPGPFSQQRPISLTPKTSLQSSAHFSRLYISPQHLRYTPGFTPVSVRLSSVSDRAGLFERPDDFQPVGLLQEFDQIFEDEPSATLRSNSRDDKGDNFAAFISSSDCKEGETPRISFPSLVTF